MELNKNIDFVYLVQGRSDLTLEFLEMLGSIPRILVATWDKPIESEYVNNSNIFFIPKTTWAEGRNFLLSKALLVYPDATYFIFSDEDVRFGNQFIEKFEDYLSRLKPGIAIPLCDRIRREKTHTDDEIEHPLWHDQNFQAFHRDIVEDGVLFPIDTTFDSVSWWLTCQMQEYLIQTYYLKRIIRFNRLEVVNSNHDQPTSEFENSSTISSYDRTGWTKEDIIELQKYIVRKYGTQKSLIQTVFQPNFMYWSYIKHFRSEHFLQLWRELHRCNARMTLRMSKHILFTVLINAVYRVLLPNRTLRGQISRKDRQRLLRLL
jgi:hypothetical protein